MALLLLLVLLALPMRLALAPLSLPFAGELEARIEAATGVDAHVGGVAVGLGASGLTVELADVRVDHPRGRLRVERARLTQNLEGRKVLLERPAARLDPAGDGALLPPAPAEAVRAFDDVLRNVSGAMDGAEIEEVTLKEGRLDLVTPGRPIGEARVFQDLSLNLAHRAGALDGTLAMVGADGPIEGLLERRPRAEGAGLTLSLSGLAPRDIGPARGVREGFAITLALTAEIPPDGRPDAALAVRIGEGTVVLGTDPPRTLDAAELVLALRGEGRTLALDPFTVRAGGSSGTATGTIVAGATPEEPWTFALEADGTTVHGEDIGKPPVSADTLRLSGRIDFVRQLLLVDRFVATLPLGRIDAVFSFDFSADGPSFAGAAAIGGSPIDLLVGGWPAVIAYDARKAIADTVLGGLVPSGRVELALMPLDMDPDRTTKSDLEDKVSVDLSFAGVTAKPQEVPLALVDARGAMRLRDETLSVRLDGARIGSGGHGDLVVVEGAMTIPDLSAQPAVANLTATVEGPLSAVVALATEMELPQIKETPLSPDDITGTVRANVAMSTPLAPDLSMEERRWSIDATLTDAGSRVPVGGQTFTDGDVEVLINSRRLAARGKATIDGLRLDVNYSELFTGAKSGAARFVLTDRDRARRGIPTGEALSGPVTVTLEAGADDKRSFSIDLGEASIDLPGLDKPAGAPLDVRGVFVGDADAIEVESFVADGSGVRAEGSLALAEGALRRAELTSLALSEGDRATVRVTPEGDGLHIEADAVTFDARRLVADLRARAAASEPSGDATAGTPVEVAAGIGRLRIADDTDLTDVAVEARHDGRRLTRLAATGRIGGVNAGSFAARLTPAADGARELKGETQELGRLLAALDVYERMRGGRAILSARLGEDGFASGRLEVGAFTLSDETSLEAIIARAEKQAALAARRSGSPGSLRVGVEPGSALTFEELALEFRKTGDTILLDDMVLRGPVLGGTGSGSIDLAARTVNVTGTIIPAYGVNNLFGRVPVVGAILGGGDEGGLIGVTFRLSGPLDNPRLVFNPLSAVAPGIFRKIFEYR